MEANKSDHMMQGFRRVMGRGAVTEDDVRIMMGIVRQTEWAVDHLDEDDRASEVPDDD